MNLCGICFIPDFPVETKDIFSAVVVKEFKRSHHGI